MIAYFKAFIAVPMMRMGCILAPQVGLLATLPMQPVPLPFPWAKATFRKFFSYPLGLLAFIATKALTFTPQFCPLLSNGSNKHMSQQPHLHKSQFIQNRAISQKSYLHLSEECCIWIITHWSFSSRLPRQELLLNSLSPLAHLNVRLGDFPGQLQAIHLPIGWAKALLSGVYS